MLCHYEVLAIARDASAVEIKKAFRLQALQWHPDKHQQIGITNEEATKQFQAIQSAYEVLSDPHEKKWYDEHRDQILRSGADTNDEDGDELNLFRYFSASVYSGFGLDTNSFYNVFGELFTKIDVLDLNESNGSKSEVAPEFGDAGTAIDAVILFYQHWKSYTTQRHFSWVDEYRTADAPTRLVRRAMEKENKKLREAAKKAFTTEVRELVDFVHRRDPRVWAFQKQKELEKEQRRRDEEARKREKQAAFVIERRAFQEQQEELWAARSMDTTRLADRDIEQELEKRRKRMDADVLVCRLCSKTFKSEKQLQNHLASKKHLNREEELGVFSDLSLLDEKVDKALQEELQQARIDSDDDDTIGTKPQAGHDTQYIDPTQKKADEKAVRLLENANFVRLEKEQKAAEKRRERKEMRTIKRKENVEKIVANARSKKEQKDEENKRSRGKKGKKQR